MTEFWGSRRGEEERAIQAHELNSVVEKGVKTAVQSQALT